MKVLPVNFANHIALPATVLAYALRLEREDAVVSGFAGHHKDVTIAGTLFKAFPGLSVTSTVSSAGAAVGNLELTTLRDEIVFKLLDVLQGRWNNAKYQLFKYVYEDEAAGVEYVSAGTLGNVRVGTNEIKAELRDYRQYLQQEVGQRSTPTCRWRLGDSRCGVDMGPHTFTSSLTQVTSNQVFRDSTRTEAAAWFKNGEFRFDEGLNAGIWVKVDDYAADGTFTLRFPMIATVVGNEDYTVKTGCTYRRDEDCFTKFNNARRFGGEPDRPTIDDLTAEPEIAV